MVCKPYGVGHICLDTMGWAMGVPCWPSLLLDRVALLATDHSCANSTTKQKPQVFDHTLYIAIASVPIIQFENLYMDQESTKAYLQKRMP